MKLKFPRRSVLQNKRKLDKENQIILVLKLLMVLSVWSFLVEHEFWKDAKFVERYNPTFFLQKIKNKKLKKIREEEEEKKRKKETATLSLCVISRLTSSKQHPQEGQWQQKMRRDFLFGSFQTELE